MEDLEQQTGEETGAADQTTGEETPAAGDVKMVPLDSLEAERKKRQELEEALERERDYAARMMSIQQVNQPEQPPAQPDMFDGMGEDDVVTVAEMKNIFQRFAGGIIQGVEHTNFTTKHPDYPEIVGTVDSRGMFKPSAVLENLLKRRPELRAHLQSTPNANARVFAYELCQAEKERMENEERLAAIKEKQANDKANDTTQPISTAAVGSGGAIDKARQFSQDPTQWTPEERAEFEKLHNDVMSGKFD